MAFVAQLNGKTIVSGNGSIIISGNKVIIDGKDVTPDTKTINIQVTGNVQELEVDSCENLTISGDCNIVSSANGNISIGGSVGSSVTTSNGDIDIAGSVGGKVTTTNGNIKYRKLEVGAKTTINGNKNCLI